MTSDFEVTGRVRHRFHGDYSAVIILDAGTASARPHLEAWLRQQAPPLKLPWRPSESALSTVVSSEELETIEEWIEPLRTDGPCRLFDCRRRSRKVRHRIGGVEHSIDHGPEFTLQVPYQDLVTPTLPGFPPPCLDG